MDQDASARPSVRLIAPDRLQIREGGGCLSLFGVPFFAAGIFGGLGALGVIPMQNADGAGRPVLVLLALVFTAVGGGLVFGRGWTTLDRAQREVVKQWGLLIPMRERRVPLQGYDAVTLGFAPGDSDSSDRFPIALKAQSGPDLPLRSFTTYRDAWACARAVADHLHLDLEDASTGQAVRVPTGQLHLTLQERLRSRTPSAGVARPPDARSQVTREHGVVTIVLPSRPLPMLMLLIMVLPAGIALTFGPSLRDFFRRTHTPDPVAWFFVGFLGLLVVLPMIRVLNGFLRSRRGATLIDVSPQRLRIRERGAWLTRTLASLDASDIVDVDYSTRASVMTSARRSAEQDVLRRDPTAATTMAPRVERMVAALLTRFGPGKGLTIKTRSGVVSFGQGLEDAEARYLHDTIVRGLIE